MNILHIDRSNYFRRLVKADLCLDSANISGCSTISGALELLKKQRIDLILSGIELDDGTASDFLAKRTEFEFGDIPIILITVKDSLEIRQKFFNLGIVDFISKNDYSAEELNEHIRLLTRQDSLNEDLNKVSTAILDDSRLSLQLIKSILQTHGINNVETFSDPLKLLDSDRDFRIYIIDMILPNISGKQMVMKLRKLHPQSIIIIISSLENYNTIAHVLASGADDYIIKPFDSRFLIARIRTNFRNFQLLHP